MQKPFRNTLICLCAATGLSTEALADCTYFNELVTASETGKGFETLMPYSVFVGLRDKHWP